MLKYPDFKFAKHSTVNSQINIKCFEIFFWIKNHHSSFETQHMFYERHKTFHPSLGSVELIAVNREVRLFSPAPTKDPLRHHFIPIFNDHEKEERDSSKNSVLLATFEREDLVVNYDLNNENDDKVTKLIVSRLSDQTNSVRNFKREFTIKTVGKMPPQVWLEKNIFVAIFDNSMVYVFDLDNTDHELHFETENKDGTITSMALSAQKDFNFLALSRTTRTTKTIIELYSVEIIPSEQTQILLRPNHQHEKKRNSPRLLTYFSSEDLKIQQENNVESQKFALSEQFSMCFLLPTNSNNEKTKRSFSHPLLASFDSKSKKILLWDLDRATRNMSTSLLRSSIDVDFATDDSKECFLINNTKLEVVEIVSSSDGIVWSFLSLSYSSTTTRSFSLFEPLNWRKVYDSSSMLGHLSLSASSSSNIRNSFCFFKRIPTDFRFAKKKTPEDEEDEKYLPKWNEENEKNISLFIGIFDGEIQFWKVKLEGEAQSTTNLNLKINLEHVKTVNAEKELGISPKTDDEKIESAFVSPFNQQNFIVRIKNSSGMMLMKVFGLCWGKTVQGSPLICRSRIALLKMSPRATYVYLEDEEKQCYTMNVE